MKKRVRRYQEGGYGDVSSEDYGMGSQAEMIERNIQENERRRMMEGPAQAAPVRSPEMVRATTVEEFQEPGSAGFSRTPTKTAKAPVVTKEQMKKAGFDNLRDYMNAQQGLKRRAEPAKPAATKPEPTKPTAAPAKSPAPAVEKPMGRSAMGKTAEMEMAAIEAGRKLKGKSEFERIRDYDKPLERVAPEMALIGGPFLRGAGAAGKAVAQAARPRVEPRIPQDAMKALTAPSKRGELATKSGELAKRGEAAPKGGELAKRRGSAEQLESPRKRLPFEKDMGPVEFAAAKNKRRLLQGEGSAKEAIKVQPRPYQRSTKSDPVDYDEIRMGSDFMRKGGKVGSASRRADGIATKGKTRGRYI